jgi:PAS domain S-box-containing protein
MQNTPFTTRLTDVTQRLVSLAEDGTHQGLSDTIMHEIVPLLDTLREEHETLAAANQTLETRSQCYQALFDHAPLSCLTTNQDGFIQNFNSSAAGVFGISDDQSTSQPISRIISDQARSSFLWWFQKMSEQPITTSEYETTVQRADGTLVPALLIVQPVQFDDTIVLQWIVQDITNQKHIEDHLRRAHDELERRIRDRTDRLFQTSKALQAETTERKRIEEAYRILVDQSLQGLCIFQDERIVFVNPAMAAITGYSLSDMLAMGPVNIQALVYPEDQAMVKTVRDQHLEGTHAPSNYMFRMVRKGGDVRWIEESVTLTEYQGKPAIQSAFIDITERKQSEDMLRLAHEELEIRVQKRAAQLVQLNRQLQAEIIERRRTEAALRESEARFRTLAETTTASIAIYQEQQIRYANDALVALSEYTLGELLTMDLLAFFPSQVQPALQQRITACLQGNQISFRNEAQIVTRSGKQCWLDVTLGAIEFEGAPAVLMTAFDITRRKHAEEEIRLAYNQLDNLHQELQHNRDMLYTLIDGLPDGLMLLDHRGMVLAINHALATFLHSTPAELICRSWHEICQQVRAPFLLERALHLSNGSTEQSYRTVYDMDGEERILDVRMFALVKPSDTSDKDTSRDDSVDHRWIVHVSDVTERCQLEARMIHNERLAASGRLAAAIAHEVNTPMQTIQTSLYMAARSDEQERKMCMDVAQDEMKRISTTLRQLLEVTRPSTGAWVKVDFNALVRRILLLTSGVLAKNRIEVECDLDPDLPMICGVAEELTQVLLNLVMNAIEAMPEGGRLWLHTGVAAGDDEQSIASTLPYQGQNGQEQREQAVIERENTNHPDTGDMVMVFEIADTGCGIRPGDQDRVFDPFFTTKDEGTGLGLFISHKIISQHRGTINVRSVVGAGSGFRITLPLTGTIKPYASK